MHTSLSQSVNKLSNGKSNTGNHSYSSISIDSSAKKVLSDVYALSTDGTYIYLETITQNSIAYYKLCVGTLTDKSVRIIPSLNHPKLTNLELLSLYLGVSVSTIVNSIISYSQSKQVNRVRQSLPVKITKNDRYHASDTDRYRARKQNKLMKGIKIV